MADFRKQPLYRTVLTMLQFAAFVGLFVAWNGKADAAGCHYVQGSPQVFEGGEQGRFAQIYLWSTGPLIRVYEGGQFHYYQAPNNGQPCDGPNCRPSRKDAAVSPPAANDGHRLTVDMTANVQALGFENQSAAAPGHSQLLLVDPIHGGPFRPPCLSA